MNKPDSADKKYYNHFYRIFCSFYKAEFYQFVAYNQNGYGLRTISLILFISFLIPTIIIYKSLSGFSFRDNKNIEIANIRENIVQFPDIKISAGKLNQENNEFLPFVITGNSQGKDLITLDPNQNSIIAANSLILFSKEGVFFSSIEIIGYLLNMFGYDNIPINQIKLDTNFIKYNEGDFVINSELIETSIELYINNLGKNLVFSVLPLTFIISLLLKIIEIIIFSCLTIVFLKKNKIKLAYKKTFAITAAALIPALIMKSLDAISMWSSRIINDPNLGGIVILSLNFYFIYFAVTSVTRLNKSS
jgi:hypothetical protein